MRKTPYIIFILLLLCAPSLLFKPKQTYFTSSSDLPAYYAAAKMMTTGRAAKVYDPKAIKQEAQKYFPDMPKERQVCFVSEPPMVLPAFAIFALFSPKEARILSETAGVLAMLGAMLLLAKTFEFSTKETTALVLLTAFSAPYWTVIRLHKPTPIILLGLCSTLLLLKNRRAAASSLSSLLCLIKPHEFLPMLAFAFGARQYRYVLSVLGIGFACALASLTLFGIEGWSNYFSLLLNMSSNPQVLGITAMPTLKGLLYRMEVDPTVANSIANVCFWGSLYLMAWFGRRFAGKNEWWIPAVAATSFLGLVLCLHAHIYDFIMVVPAIAILFKHAAFIEEQFTHKVLWVVATTSFVPLYSIIYAYSQTSGLHWHCLLYLGAGISAAVSVSSMIQESADKTVIDCAPGPVIARDRISPATAPGLVAKGGYHAVNQ